MQERDALRRAGKRVILIADDDEINIRLLSHHLRGMGEIVACADGAATVERTLALLPDILLLDVNMPVMDGYEFLTQFRQMSGGDDTKIIFCTTENDIAHISRALMAGANEYIMKPFDKEIVEAKFQEVGLL